VERGRHDFGADAIAMRDSNGDKIRCHVCTVLLNQTEETGNDNSAGAGGASDALCSYSTYFNPSCSSFGRIP
jgi:hypothetical protein